ncbi:hypothetical protein GCM10007304_34780 [Rhodococcoides trifolii]|uniref:Uncharacterized protein n=1 Tax=Rhodococcoides trifolii TaxID=908250 RepID=A0A917LF51_9NOCA|nr:hypothetical protein GCM10007304_34780 [Rhodococcus trifolii]
MVVGLRPVGVLLALVAALSIVTLVSANSDLTGTFGAIAGSWLAVHHVPLGIGGADLGILPLLPTIVLMVSVARACAGAVSETSTRRDVCWVLAAALGAPLVFAAVMLAMIQDASSVIPLTTPNALVTFGWVLAVHATAAAVGLVVGTWPGVLQRVHLAPWAVAAFVPAARAVATLVAGGAVLVVASLVMSWSTVGALLETGDGVIGSLGLTVVSILYLPNVVIGAAAVVTGSSAHVGAATVSLFDTAGGPIPAVPVLAALPESSAQVWWPAMLVVPVLAAYLLGRGCASATLSAPDALRAAATAAVMVSLVAVIAGFVAGGVMGTFGDLGVDVLILGVATFGWSLVVGGSTAAVAGHLLHRDEVTDAWLDHHDEADEPVELAEPMAAIEAAPEPEDDVVEEDVPAEEPVANDDDVVDAEVVEIDDPDETR